MSAEPTFRSPTGDLRPDLVAHRECPGVVLDVMVVTMGYDADHHQKAQKSSVREVLVTVYGARSGRSPQLCRQ